MLNIILREYFTLLGTGLREYFTLLGTGLKCLRIESIEELGEHCNEPVHFNKMWDILEELNNFTFYDTACNKERVI
jgi:hypothetical protein